MTKDKISYMFSQLNTIAGSNLYEFNSWLDMDEVTEIILYSDQNVYPDKNITIKFLETEELMVLARKKSASKRYIYSFIPFSHIVGFMLLSAANGKSPYLYGSTL